MDSHIYDILKGIYNINDILSNLFLKIKYFLPLGELEDNYVFLVILTDLQGEYLEGFLSSGSQYQSNIHLGIHSTTVTSN